MCCNMADSRPKLMNKKNNKCSTKKKIEIEKVVEQILPSMGKGKSLNIMNFKKLRKKKLHIFLNPHF